MEEFYTVALRHSQAAGSGKSAVAEIQVTAPSSGGGRGGSGYGGRFGACNPLGFGFATPAAAGGVPSLKRAAERSAAVANLKRKTDDKRRSIDALGYVRAKGLKVCANCGSGDKDHVWKDCSAPRKDWAAEEDFQKWKQGCIDPFVVSDVTDIDASTNEGEGWL